MYHQPIKLYKLWVKGEGWNGNSLSKMFAVIVAVVAACSIVLLRKPGSGKGAISWSSFMRAK